MSQRALFEGYDSELEVLTSERPRYIISGIGIYPAEFARERAFRAFASPEPGVQTLRPNAFPEF